MNARIELQPVVLAPCRTAPAVERGIALLAVLFALTLLAVLALPFAVSMGVGADAAARDVERAKVEQASASVRDLLLGEAALSHPMFDPTPTFDSLDEWPDQVELPDKFAPLREEGRVLLGGSVWDLQRFLALDSVSPLVLGNLLGTTTRLSSDLAPDAASMVVDDASRLPEQGFVWLAHEVVRYAGKQGNTLTDLQRGLFQEQGFVKSEQPIAETTLVLDYRCVIAAAWPFLGRGDGARSARRPYAATTELAEIATLGIGAFTQDELDVLAGALSEGTQATTSSTWGRPERVFDALIPGAKVLRVKSALHLGAGSTVRLRDTRSGAVEYGLVMIATNEQFVRDLHLPSMFRLELLMPLGKAFPAIDTVVEPLIPVPVNVNTASAAVLTAVFAEVRRATGVQVHDGDGRRRQTPLRGISRSEAKALADEIEALRAGDANNPGQGPLRGWQDFCERLMKPRFEAAQNDTAKMPWLYLYRNLQTGRDSTIEMGTVPITFQSGPWVGFRAASSRSRSTVAPGVASRHERTGVAAAVPGFQLEHDWSTQELLEDAFLLDRRAPGYVTTPINLGALLVNQNGGGDEAGNDPASRYYPHLVPMAFRMGDFGASRFASQDPTDAAITASPAIAVPRQWRSEMLRHESFASAQDPRGRDVTKEGAYQIQNNGPRGGAGTPTPTSGRHDRISFPFSNPNGFADRFATSFWLQPQSLAGVTLFDHSDGDPLRNRLSLLGRDGNLVLEVIDEAGIDPDPPPSGVQRTATQWNVPLADLALPADTPVHFSVSAYGSRPSELSLAVDGMPRGKGKYITYLTAPLKPFDPTLANNQAIPPSTRDERYLDLQVESTEGFPSVGILRVGIELFEYTSISGNAFQGRWQDSTGGRGARQIGREFRPDIPLDAAGNPTVDIDTLQAQGVNLDVFPEHPVGTLVELYGYSALLSEDSPMMPGTTTLTGTLGGFSVARGYIQNPRPISITVQGIPPIPIGDGIDENWTGELLLADPIPGRNYPPAAGQAEITDSFSTGGGYALLVQIGIDFESNVQGRISSSVPTGGVELIRYSARQGNKLTGVQRAQTVPGQDNQIDRGQYDGTARKFVTDWRDMPWDPLNQQVWYDDVPTAILWVVPVSIAVQSTASLWDPASSGLLEWVQLYPEGGDPNDTEWVRYDAILGNTHLLRGNRSAWDRTRFTLTQATGRNRVQIGNLGSNNSPGNAMTNPWGSVSATSGYIGYIPKLEADYPQINAARMALRFRGDPFTRTSSHAHTGSVVMQCQRLQLNWGNFGALTGRVGRHDRVAIVQGSVASGVNRPAVEWHTTNWSCRRFNADNLAPNQTPPERYGPWPFQLVAFTDGVRGQYLGPPRGTVVLEPRMYDRVVKFPSGELPAAYAENVFVGSGVGNESPMRGLVDEIDVVRHDSADLVVDEPFTAGANTFRCNPGLTYTPAGPVYFQADLSANFPAGGGLLWVDGEVIAYQSRSNGDFNVATNGRGLLGTEARGHDRGARVHFLTHRPAAILASGVGARDDVLMVQALAAMPRNGTALLGRELLHYTWTRQSGDQGSLEMPRWFPPGDDGNSSAARGLFRGRFGTTAMGGSAGEVVIAWPFRYWDRYAETNDDPELAYFQLTMTEAPSFYRSLIWREETQDARVDVVCLVRTDSRAPWSADPTATPGLWLFNRGTGDDRPTPLGVQASRLEVRFATVYKPGVFDLLTGKAHGWKTTSRIDKVRVQYEGQGRILDERVTGR